MKKFNSLVIRVCIRKIFSIVMRFVFNYEIRRYLDKVFRYIGNGVIFFLGSRYFFVCGFGGCERVFGYI